MIRKHKEIGFTPVFAGGIWTWTGLCTNYGRTLLTSDAALSACKKEGVKEVIATVWGDDGMENNPFTALMGFQIFAEHGYAADLDIEKLKQRVKFCTGVDYKAFMDIPWADWDTKYPLILTAGEKYDLIYAANWTQFANYANKGAFKELDDLLVSTEIAAVTQILQQYELPLIWGKSSNPSKDLESLKSKLKAAGSDKILDEVKKQLGEYFKK